MTDVNKKNSELISSFKDALALFKPSPSSMTNKMGVEIEMGMFSSENENQIIIPTSLEVEKIKKALEKRGQMVQLEAAGVIEYASNPVSVDQPIKLLKEMKKDLEVFEEEIQKQGFKRSPVSILPSVTIEDAMAVRSSRERLNIALSTVPNIFKPEALTIPLLTTAIQASFSPTDKEAMFRMAKRAYALTPLLMLVTNSHTGFLKNNPIRQNKHFRGKGYDCHEASGGIADSFLKSSNGDEWVKNHIKSIFDIPMYFACNKDGSTFTAANGNPVTSTKRNPLTFRKLIKEGLNTISNFHLAESFMYNDVKICNLSDEFGKVAGKRLEVRAADSGLHQPEDLILLTSALIPDGETAIAFEALLKKYGFTGDPTQDTEFLLGARNAVVENWDHAWKEGNFGKGKMTDFSRDLANIMEDHYINSSDDISAIEKPLSRLLNDLRSCESDATRLANSEHGSSLEKVNQWILKANR